MRYTILICVLIVLIVPTGLLAQRNVWWDFPAALPPDEYGNILISRTSEKGGVKPATFSHWLHRRRHTCRVCHFELEFNMKVNTTEITEAANRAGQYCGASGCHDGRAAFGHQDKADCEKCHNNNRGYGKEQFQELTKALPRTSLGNEINWSRAIARKMIEPLYELSIKPSDVTYDKRLELAANWAMIPPAIFSHKTHIKWLDCNNCHPDIFNIKKKGTIHFTMARNLKGEFCGVCHLTVAFPMNDCKACHPGIG